MPKARCGVGGITRRQYPLTSGNCFSLSAVLAFSALPLGQVYGCMMLGACALAVLLVRRALAGRSPQATRPVPLPFQRPSGILRAGSRLPDRADFTADYAASRVQVNREMAVVGELRQREGEILGELERAQFGTQNSLSN